MRTSARTRSRYFSAVVFLAAVGCRDADPPTTPAADPPPALTLAADGVLRDGGIDPRDTYFAFNVTTTRTVEGGSAREMGIASAESEEYDGRNGVPGGRLRQRRGAALQRLQPGRRRPALS